MLVVPVPGDKVRTVDDSSPRVVSSFTSLKDQPAVYLDQETSKERFIYFSDIVEINGVTVEYQSDSKVFSALGPLKRKYNIPQPKDVIVVRLLEKPHNDEKEEVEVTKIRLHSKKEGISRGLLACGKESCFTLAEVLDLRRSSWSEKFDASQFHRYYRDYLPFGLKTKG